MAQRYVGLLMNSRTQAHAFHLTTPSYAEHKALQAYYEGIVPLLDAWAEAFRPAGLAGFFEPCEYLRQAAERGTALGAGVAAEARM